jgi:hypothetical protein
MIFMLVFLQEPVKRLIDRVLYASFVSEVEPVQRLEERAPAQLRLQRVTLRLLGNSANGPP